MFSILANSFFCSSVSLNANTTLQNSALLLMNRQYISLRPLVDIPAYLSLQSIFILPYTSCIFLRYDINKQKRHWRRPLATRPAPRSQQDSCSCSQCPAQPLLTSLTFFLWVVVLNTFICSKEPYFQNLGVWPGGFGRASRHRHRPWLHQAAPTPAPTTPGRVNAGANYTWSLQRRRGLHLAAPSLAPTTPGHNCTGRPRTGGAS